MNALFAIEAKSIWLRFVGFLSPKAGDVTGVFAARWIDVEVRPIRRVDLDAHVAVLDAPAFAFEPSAGLIKRGSERVVFFSRHFDRFGDVDALVAAGAHFAQAFRLAREGQADAQLFDVEGPVAESA